MPPFRPLFAAALSAACLPAVATTWLCGLSEDAVRLVCVADANAAAPAVSTPTTQVRGTGFPLDPGRVWTVDLWSPPSDAEFVAQLAQATICYRSPGCQIVMGWWPMPGSTLVAIR